MNYGPQGTLNAILTIVMIILVIYIFPFRDLRSERINKKRNEQTKRKNEEQVRKNEEYRDYLREQNAMAQAKRDEQIRLLGEVLQNQREILDELKRGTTAR